MWPNPPLAAADEAEESGSYRRSKVVVSNDDGDGSDGDDKLQSNRFIGSNMFYSIATPLQLGVTSCNCNIFYS
jgi:hypothetical protein